MKNKDNKKYKYDVAFSFLAQDETLATELNDHLQDRLSTFLYSKRQEEIAGTDGEKTFNTIFGEQARLVVVLYRAGWGESPWTRIEETAIRNRAFEEGYDFVNFIPIEGNASIPRWLPKTQLWVGLKRWGVIGAASVIEMRVNNLGGLPREESVEDRAKRLERALQFRDRRKEFLNSHEGVNASKAEFAVMTEEIERLLVSIKESTSSISYDLKKADRTIVVLGPHAGLSITWQYHWSNSLDDSKLEVILWEGHPPFPGLIPVNEPKRRKSISFKFDLNKSEQLLWISKSLPEREFDSKALSAYVIKFYMDDAHPKK